MQWSWELLKKKFKSRFGKLKRKIKIDKKGVNEMTENKIIESVIKGVENGTVELDEMAGPDFLKTYSEYFIVYYVEGYEGDDYIQVVFAEHDLIKDAREKNNCGQMSDEELEKLLDYHSNDYEDRFNFDKVVGVSKEPLGLQWI